MALGHTTRVTPEELQMIFDRLQPHLPPYLQRVEPSPYGGGLRYEFAPFTGREEEPTRPESSYDDPKLRYVPEPEDAAEHLLRENARNILSDVYAEAYRQWKDAAHVADLKQIVRDAPARWKAYEQALQKLQSAYDYLRTPQAGAEWMAAISRLVDAQNATLAAATAFEDRARDIAEVHYKHLYSDLSHDEALKRAGYPEAKDWHVGNDFDGRYTGGLRETALRLVEEQNDHVTKVGRL